MGCGGEGAWQEGTKRKGHISNVVVFCERVYISGMQDHGLSASPAELIKEGVPVLLTKEPQLQFSE